MDLLGILRQEIADLKLTDKLKISQYIYKRTGELFEYDPRWIFSTLEERNELRNKKLDIQNVTDFDITCFSWSKLYNELLHNFGIVSRIKYIKEEVPDNENNTTVVKPVHAYVEVFINGRIYMADLTASYKDMIGIKFGLETYYNCQLSKTSYSDKYEFDHVSEEIYKKNISVEELISNLKNELALIEKNSDDREEYIYQVYKKIGELINVIKANTGYVIGVKYVQALLKLFLGDDHLMQNIYFFNKDKSVYIAVHQVMVERITHYFAYSRTSTGNYEMHEVSRQQVDTYFEMYNYKLSKDLNGMYLNGIPKLK